MKLYEIVSTWDIGELDYLETTEAICSDKEKAEELKSKIEKEVKYYQNIKCPIDNYDATDDNFAFLKKISEEEREEFTDWYDKTNQASGFVDIVICEWEADRWDGIFNAPSKKINNAIRDTNKKGFDKMSNKSKLIRLFYGFLAVVAGTQPIFRNHRTNTDIDTIIENILKGKESKLEISEFVLKLENDDYEFEAWNTNKYYAWLSSGTYKNKKTEFRYSWNNEMPSRFMAQMFVDYINQIVERRR